MLDGVNGVNGVKPQQPLMMPLNFSKHGLYTKCREVNKHAGELSFLGILGCVVISSLDIASDVLLDLSICASILFPMFNRLVTIKTNARHVKVCY